MAQCEPRCSEFNRLCPRTRLLLVRQHPDKTEIGRIACGFDFLGYRFSSAGLTVERCVARLSRIYEQGAVASRIGTYVRRWER